MGIRRNVKGLEKVSTSGTGYHYAWVTQFVFNVALVIRNSRAAQRLGSIKATAGATSSTVDVNKLIEMQRALPGKGKQVMYANRRSMGQLEIIAKDKPNVFYTVQNEFGVPITYFRGMPIHLAEMLTNTENDI
jgi:hypothetical protein